MELDAVDFMDTATLRLKKPYADLTIEERRERYRRRREIAHGSCSRCQLDGTNVVHDWPGYREGDPYHEWNPDVPFHFFRPLSAITEPVR